MSGINSPAKDAGDFQIEWDEERDEPFCRIDVRGKEYHMTMWRESDADDMVSITISSCPEEVQIDADSIQVNLWNHPLVGKWSYKRPFPYVHLSLRSSNILPQSCIALTDDISIGSPTRISRKHTISSCTPIELSYQAIGPIWTRPRPRPRSPKDVSFESYVLPKVR
jgi:hypothetical protein